MRTAEGTASRSFPPEPVSVRAARRFLEAFLKDGDGGDGDDLREAAELALSEVVTNAVLHAHTPFDVTLSLSEDGALRVEVSDRNPQLPVQRHYAEQATTGRGMDLVAAYTHDCGVEGHGPTGKTVWFVVRPGADPEQQSEQDLLDSWGIDLDDASWAAQETSVVLLGLPPTLWLAAREHHDAVLRELVLWATEHPEQSPELEQLARADEARGTISSRVITELERLGEGAAKHRVLPEGHPSALPDTPESLDLELRVDPAAASAFAALQDVLDLAESLATRGLLLARPGLPEIIAVRDWACESVISQLSGVRPSPWPGTDQERFTSQLHDRHEPSTLTWDAAVVAESDVGAVAADDANRIIAVSRPLARALGWEVEQLVGRRVVVLIPPRLREAHVAGFTRHLTTGETHAVGVPLRLPVLRADGREVECGFLIEQTPATSGRAVYIAWIDPPEGAAQPS